MQINKNNSRSQNLMNWFSKFELVAVKTVWEATMIEKISRSRFIEKAGNRCHEIEEFLHVLWRAECFRSLLELVKGEKRIVGTYEPRIEEFFALNLFVQKRTQTADADTNKKKIKTAKLDLCEQMWKSFQNSNGMRPFESEDRTRISSNSQLFTKHLHWNFVLQQQRPIQRVLWNETCCLSGIWLISANNLFTMWCISGKSPVFIME